MIMISDARGGHVSPGIYTEEKDVTYSVKSLGITSLGLVGETLYGPAFENIEIENWGEFVDYFGGTSPEKFKGTGLPKYELPYIAKSYLEESKRLNVVRVLGLSGYHAGPAWVLSTAANSAAVVILRSKMIYGYNELDRCASGDPDEAAQVVTNITVTSYTPTVYDSECVEVATARVSNDPSRFQIVVATNGIGGFNGTYKYNVSLNPSDSDYIYKVISSNPSTGNTPIYIEAVYENAWDGETKITACTQVVSATVVDIKYWKRTEEKMVEDAKKDDSGNITTPAQYSHKYEEVTSYPNTKKPIFADTLISHNGGSVQTITDSASTHDTYLFTSASTSLAVYDDFISQYRAAQTPWIVSDVAADSETATMRKLFRFITISDGDAANTQIKVSIQNIRPVEGTFDVVVRDFYDNDTAPMILERFSKCSLVEGDASYIAFKIGTIDGGYASKSKYIAVDMAEGEDLSNNIPAGFLGYPMPPYGDNREMINVKYNNLLNMEIKPKRQYFGFGSDNTDADIFAFKGAAFYDNEGTNTDWMTNGFHMDSVLSKYNDTNIFVDGQSGFKFTTVSRKNVGSETAIPRLINASYLDETIYKDIATRKFTVCFYGGFDGWDVNREQRTNTDKYKASNFNISESAAFGKVSDDFMNASLNLPSTAITTDYYAYLAGYRRMANPQDVDINIFVTPGIDWYNNLLLTEDAIDVVEDKEDGRGGDALYIMASPRDAEADEITKLFEETEIDSSFACTYYPWVMYYDASNKKYLDLPVTKDVVRNMAATDNNSYPWFAPAGIERGVVNCVKAAHKTTLAEEDELYEAGINPVKSFAQDGVKVWGNKTAYKTESPLNRINVRRLMIRVQKLVKDAAKHLIFEQYDDTLEKQFRGLVEPILADVKANRGIFDYRVMTECTPETRDQHILPAKILIKPTPALEYISISFVVYPESVDFEEN